MISKSESTNNLTLSEPLQNFPGLPLTTETAHSITSLQVLEAVWTLLLKASLSDAFCDTPPLLLRVRFGIEQEGLSHNLLLSFTEDG